MKSFDHVNAKTVDEAITLLKDHKGKAKLIAGGTDLLGILKDQILPEYPETIINIKTIQELDYIEEDAAGLKIGALAKLADIADNPVIKEKYKVLAMAAESVATPQIRNVGTVGGNLVQDVRCWYYRYPHQIGGRIMCTWKGSGPCAAVTGDNRYHSIFGSARVNGKPCSNNCPAHLDIPSCLSKIRDGNLDDAARIILKYNPLPAITGRVCPYTCESGCNRGSQDEPVSIRAIERFMGDYILENTNEIFEPPQSKSDKSIAIVGSGPAGLAAAYFLRTLGHNITVFEAMEEPGGMLTYGIPPYRLPKDVVRNQVEALKSTGIHFTLNTEIGKDTGVEELMNTFDAVFLACGAWKERLLDIKGEHLILSGTEFLRDLSHHTEVVSGKKVAVIGGGNVALDVARTLLRLGGEPVIIYRRSRNEMTAQKEEVDRAEQEGIETQFLTLPVEVSKKDNILLLECTRMELGPLDETGRPQPIPVEGSEFTIEFDIVIKATGEEPDTSIVPGAFLDDARRLKVDSSGHYLGRNVFAGGDCVTGPSSVITAVAAGRSAASVIDQYLGGTGLHLEENDVENKNLPEKFDSSSFKAIGRIITPELPVSERIKSIYIEDVGRLDLSAVQTESNRCYDCGCMAVNSSDIAPVLIALDAKIKTTKRLINAEKFFSVEGNKTTILDDDEILTEIQIPEIPGGTEQKYLKFTLRKPIDFAIVSVTSLISIEAGIVRDARIVLGSVAMMPIRATTTEEAIKGKAIDEATAEMAATIAVADAKPLSMNGYKVEIAKSLVKNALFS